MTGKGAQAAGSLWQPSKDLSGRVRRLREEYFSFHDREHFRNEVMPFGAGTPWDIVYTLHTWTIVPEVMPFMRAFEDSLAACAETVELPEDFWDDPLVLRRARFFSEVLRSRLPVQILDGELIVGGQFNAALSLSLTEAETRAYDKAEEGFISEALELDELGVGNCGAVPGHVIPDYKKALSLGLSGLVREAEKLITRRSGPENDVRRALIVTARGARDLILRYADEAGRLAAACEDGERRAELLDVQAVCKKISWDRPETLQEALQLLWFLHMLVMTAESYPGPGLSPGRVDQYLNPYYQADVEAGRLDRESARELLQCWWLKHNYAYDFQGRVGNNQGITAGFGQLVTLGGIGPDGEDASNDLTWLLLDVLEDMNTLEPKPNIRLHRKTPPELMNRVAELVARAQGSPFLLNFDERSMEGLRWQGLPEEDLWDYAPVGCLENTLQGNDRSGTVDVNFNLAKAVELVFSRGLDRRTGRRVGPDTGDPGAFDSFDAFYDAVKEQTSHLLDRIIRANDRADGVRARYQPTPYLSLLMDGCARSGRDITAGGAEHNWLTVEGIAFATAVDSLLAVRSLVFEQGRLTMGELDAALAANFDGHEKVRLLMENKAPKYGNDDESADALADDFHRFWTEAVSGRTAPETGKRYRCGYLSWNYWVCYGLKTGATPDGRPSGRFLSNGSCPVTGRDRQGPTANARSVARLGMETAPNGDSHTISFSPSLLRDREHVEKLAGFLRGYARQGGTALQVNVIDAETLRRAQSQPDEYRNLLVRVTGYNAYFVTLGREIQNEIISREAHRL